MDEVQRLRNKALAASLEKEMIFRFDGDVEGVEGPLPSVKVHVDLMPPDICLWKSETINGMNMGECLSVHFSEGELPVIKVGENETIFNIYAMNHISWELKKMKQLSNKTDRKGKTKLEFVCKIISFGGNAITKEQWAKFEAKRSKPYKHDNPTLIHWEYVKSGEAQGMGYWKSDDIMELIPE